MIQFVFESMGLGGCSCEAKGKKELGRDRGLGNAPYTEGTTWDIWRDERGRHSDGASEVYGGGPPRAVPPGLGLAVSMGVCGHGDKV